MSATYFKLKKGLNEISCRLDSLSLFVGSYKIQCNLTLPQRREIIDHVKDIYAFNVTNFDPYNTGFNARTDQGNGIFYIDHKWIFEK